MHALVLDADWAPAPEYDLTDRERADRRAEDGSAVWRDPRVRVVERDRPDPAADEALVRVAYAGVCGSDVAMIETGEDGYMHYPAYASLPNVLGHEFAGRVVETGAAVDRVAPGDLVTADVTDFCGVCDSCREGYPTHCENFEQLGFTIPGAFAEYVAVPERVLWDVTPLRAAYPDDETVLKAAATIEPSTISYHGFFERADDLRPGDHYAIHGGGPIGLTAMNVARAGGAGRVILFEPQAERRETARALGFEHVYDPFDVDAAATVRSVTDGRGADVHVEASGAVAGTYPAIGRSLAEDATVVHISNAGEPAPMDTRRFQSRLAQWYATEGSGKRSFPWVIRLMAAGRLDNLPIVTSEFPLSEADAAVERAAERVDGKVLIRIAPEETAEDGDEGETGVEAD